ncbi:PREDICTED: mitogen-activated protein kinase 16-like isoform X2 [Tarenaya hassleriana]|uniref:mitogen-activated protein kinase 16-like isoform X2 n=1 Tax=Tarenaya hassleriana TaxID=28532 RepID=UPI00053C406B|nr:PREDICTED: mitogen-activated protein kinase 16-like isoform X2 [Tarenaya hassleriana]
MQPDQRKKSSVDVDFFTEYGEGSRYRIEEVIGKGSYGVVCSAYDTHTAEKVAIKKINDIFEHVSDATRILREIKLLRLLRHPDIVEIKHILLPPSRREFKDIYVVFELMESDLHQVIKANDDLTPEHYQFFLYQLLRGLKYIHTANVFHRDMKPKNILANADCKLKICDFGLARVAFSDTPTAIFWTDYVATRWYRAPELCGSFFSKYTPAIDIWSIGCIFAELLTGKPLFPGKNVVHQLDLMTELLGTPSVEAIARVRNEKARRYLSSMRKKKPVPFSHKFPNADPLALRLLERMLAFEPKDRPTAEEALADPYFKGLAKVEREPSAQPVTKMEFEFERRRITKEDVRELIYREILEYHPKMLKEHLEGSEPTGFMYPSAVDHFKKQFAFLEEHYKNGTCGAPPERQHASLPRASVLYSDKSQNSTQVTDSISKCSIREIERNNTATRIPIQAAKPGKAVGSSVLLRYNKCGAAATGSEAMEQQRRSSVRNHPPAQYATWKK